MQHAVPQTARNSTSYPLQIWYNQGRNEGGKGGTIPRAPIHCGAAESLRGRRITAGAAEKSQQCQKRFRQYSKFAFQRAQVPPWGRQTSTMGAPIQSQGRQTCFCPGHHLTSLRPWVQPPKQNNLDAVKPPR